MSLILNANESGVCGYGHSMLRFHRTSAIIGASVAVAGLGYSVYNSEHQKSQANKIQKSLVDPTYTIPPEFYQNREIARQMSQVGIPQQQYNNATNNINQNEAAGIAALNNSANPGAGVTSVVRQGNTAKANLDAEDAQARQNNQRYFVNENSQLGNQELAKQQSDVFDKFTRNFNMMEADRGAGMQNENTAVNGATQLGMTALNYAGNNSNQTPSWQKPSAKLNADLTAHPYQIQVPSIDGNIPGLPPYQLAS